MKRTRAAAAALAAAGAVLGAAAGAAGAWEASPYPLRRMAAEADAVAIGTVEAVETLARDGAWETARATVRVREWLAGGPGARAWVTFNPKVDGAVDLAVSFAKGERVLLFLRKRLPGAPLSAGLAAAPPAPDPEQDWVVQIAKGRVLGYRLRAGARLEGLLDAADPRTLAEAREIVATGGPAPAPFGLRATLWTDRRSAELMEEVPFRATLRNAGRAAVRLPADRLLGRAELVATGETDWPRGAFMLGELVPRDGRGGGAGPSTAPAADLVLAPGAEHTIELSIAPFRVLPGHAPIDFGGPGPALRSREDPDAPARGPLFPPDRFTRSFSDYYPARPLPWRPPLPRPKPPGTIRPPPRAADAAVAEGPAVATRVADRLFLAVRWTFLFDRGAPADRWTGIVVSNRTVLDIVKGPPLK